MKKTLVIALGLAILGGNTFAQTNQVLSRNAVGYVKADALKDKFVMLTHNFKDLNGAPVTATNLIGNQVPNSSSIILWDPGAQAYRFETRVAGAWDPGTNPIPPGRGFWLRIPPSAASNTYRVYLMGEVPDKLTLPTNVATIVPGFNMVGFPYPITIPFTSSVLAINGKNTDSAIFWDPTGQAYYFETRVAGAWDPGTNVLQPGQGFWYRSTRTTNMTWTQSKPYTWP